MKQAKRYNQDKPDLHYLDPWFDALCEVARVCMKGAEKYERGNYLQGQPYSQLIGCAYRHQGKFGDFRRPDIDPETGRHHIAHAIWNLLQLLQHEVGSEPLTAGGWDDRLKPPGWERNASTHGLGRPTNKLRAIPPGGLLKAAQAFRGDDDSRERDDYEQDTLDMEAAAKGAGRLNPEPWLDAIKSWLTGEPLPDDVIDIAHCGSTEQEFIVNTGKSIVKVTRCGVQNDDH